MILIDVTKLFLFNFIDFM